MIRRLLSAFGFSSFVLLVALALLIPRPALGGAPDASIIQCLPYTPKQADGSTTILHLLNISPSISTMVLQFYQGNGTIVSSHTLSAQPNRVLPLDLASLNFLPNGVYATCIGSNQPFMATTYLENLDSKTLGVYPNPLLAPLSTSYYGPFFTVGENALATSKLVLLNATNSTITVTLNSVGGSTISNSYKSTVQLPAFGATTWTSTDLPENVTFANDVGWVIVEAPANATVIGVLENTLPDGQKIYLEQMSRDSTSAASLQAHIDFVPRLHLNTQETDAAFVSHLYAGNGGTSQSVVTTMLYNATGTPSGTIISSIGAGQLSELPLQQGSPMGQAVSAVIGSNQRILLANMATTNAGDGFSMDSYLSSSSLLQTVPSVLRDENYFSVIGVQNTGTQQSTVSIDLFLVETAGDRLEPNKETVKNVSVTIAPNATYSLDLRTIADPSGPIIGHAQVQSQNFGSVLVQVDLYSVIPSESTETRIFLPSISR